MPQEILSSLLDDAKHLTLLPTLNVKAKRFQDIGEQNLITRHMGPEHAWREEILSVGYFFICVHKNLYRIGFQEIKIGSLQGFEKIKFSHISAMRKRLRNHFWPLESRFLMRKSEKNSIFSKPYNGRILISWNPILYTFLCTKIKRYTMNNIFSFDACSGPMWGC